MTASTDACVFCQAVVPTNTMEVTGHGLRCLTCTQQSELAAIQNGGNMAEHLTQDELENIASSAQKEVVSGALLTFAGAAATVASLAIGFRGKIVIACAAAFLGGICLLFRGISDKREAKRAQSQFPSARAMQS